MDLRERIDSLASALGFDRVGVAQPEPDEDTRFLRHWLSCGYAGEMHYLARRAAEREDPRRLLTDLRSVISVGLVYDPGEPAPPVGASSARIARYAGGDDYHEVLGGQLRALAAALEAWLERPFAWRAYVDTGPVLERAMAARAGLGWIGKNTCLIHPRLGSYLFLGVLLTDLTVPSDEPMDDHCGSCRACLDACPTGAFPEPYVMDATRCLSYSTIERKGTIPEELRGPQADWVFGCDICQEVCPWNRRRGRGVPDDPLGLRARLAPRPEWRRPTLAWLLDLDEAAWQRVTRNTALRRAKWRGLMRNTLVSAGNAADPSLIPRVERLTRHEDPLVAAHARWAEDRLRRVAGPGEPPRPAAQRRPGSPP